MKRLLLGIVIVLLLSGCGILDRGNYEKDQSGFVLQDGLIATYHTNQIGEIDVFQMDYVMSFFEALEYSTFPINQLDDHNNVSSIVSVSELAECNIVSDEAIPRFLRIENKTYYYNNRDNGYCTYDEYIFYEEGYNIQIGDSIEDTSPIKNKNISIFQEADFYVNTFETILFIETVHYNNNTNLWEKEIVQALPMSIKQAGNMIEDTTSYIAQVSALEQYVLNNQSINLLELKEDFTDPNINAIWTDETIDILGRDHEVIKTVRFHEAKEYLELIDETLRRLGMFS